MFILGDTLCRAVGAVSRPKGVVDEQVGVGGQLLTKTATCIIRKR